MNVGQNISWLKKKFGKYIEMGNNWTGFIKTELFYSPTKISA